MYCMHIAFKSFSDFFSPFIFQNISVNIIFLFAYLLYVLVISVFDGTQLSTVHCHFRRVFKAKYGTWILADFSLNGFEQIYFCSNIYINMSFKIYNHCALISTKKTG